MKKLIIITLSLIIITIIARFGLGFGAGKISKKSENSNVVQKTAVSKETKKTNAQTEAQTEKRVIRVSVVGNEYFHENERTSLDDFISKIQTMTDIVLEVKDDMASLKAYNNLLNRLEEVDIPYTEC